MLKYNKVNFIAFKDVYCYMTCKIKKAKIKKNSFVLKKDEIKCS